MVHRPSSSSHTPAFSGGSGGTFCLSFQYARYRGCKPPPPGLSATVSILRNCESPSGPHQNQNLSPPVNSVRYQGLTAVNHQLSGSINLKTFTPLFLGTSETQNDLRSGLRHQPDN